MVSMVKTCSAGKLPAFTSMPPLFDVAAGYLIMNDPLTPALTCVTGGGRRPLISIGLPRSPLIRY